MERRAEEATEDRRDDDGASRNYVAGLLKALGARNRLEAALIALRNGLVSLDLG